MQMLSIGSWGVALTLGTRELALLLTRLNGAVDVGLESLIGKVVDLVVGLDVLLDSLTAVEVWSARALKRRKTKA
jgi:hypothetical protein